ncbi:MAG: glutathione S-transferase [Rhodovarius sp.]|nr:glutathione S-transferase [Rhodovarius sp.]MCX7931202.1 glutathione S-transferase [Rhodovarius sp.]MDW8314042.1 glutathione S-transferase [Rhodovarius sp.]
MPEGRLIIGTQRYSSWSLRGWLAVRLAGLDVEEVVLPITGTGASPALAGKTPTGLVPYLEHRGARVWESLSIIEYCAEWEASLWPADRTARAWCRSIATEMQGGFRELRMAMPYNAGRSFPGGGRTPGALKDIARIEAIWGECLAASGGPFLFGSRLTGADVMYAPVVGRFLTWQPELSAGSRAYCEAIRAHPLIELWYEAAAATPAEWLIDKYENPQ